MRFLVDECTGTRVADWLREEGYEVFSVYDRARGISDDVIINKAFDENWILITNDKDFGEKVHREKYPHRGIIFLRLQDERSNNKIRVLQRLLSMYLQRIPDNFVVVTEKQVRFRTQS
jgi:predicted nuclease of predicted toxin-antitoxin system